MNSDSLYLSSVFSGKRYRAIEYLSTSFVDANSLVKEYSQASYWAILGTPVIYPLFYVDSSSNNINVDLLPLPIKLIYDISWPEDIQRRDEKLTLLEYCVRNLLQIEEQVSKEIGFPTDIFDVANDANILIPQAKQKRIAETRIRDRAILSGMPPYYNI